MTQNNLPLRQRIGVAGIGLATLVQSLMPGFANAGEIRTLQELNEAIAPYNLDASVKQNPNCKQFDKDGDGFPETTGCLYLTKDGGRIAIYKIKDNIFNIAVDSNRSGEFDYFKEDKNCNGIFEPNIGKVNIPDCLKR